MPQARGELRELLISAKEETLSFTLQGRPTACNKIWEAEMHALTEHSYYL